MLSGAVSSLVTERAHVGGVGFARSACQSKRIIPFAVRPAAIKHTTTDVSLGSSA